MSAKLRSRLRKRGRGVVECDDENNCVYYNVTRDLLGKDVGEEWLNIEVPIKQYKYIVRNDDEVIDRISSDVRNLRENSAWRAMALKTKADIRRSRKTLIDFGCNRTIFTNRLLIQDFQKCLITSSQ